jgi:hypothetical protein
VSADPVSDFLDELLAELRVSPRRARRILQETEDHLRRATDDHVQAGMEPEEAARAAVARFGAPRSVAAGFPAEPRPFVPSRAIRMELAWQMALLGSIGLIAIGLSGLLAAGMGMAFGKQFIAGDPPGVTYTFERCNEYLELTGLATVVYQVTEGGAAAETFEGAPIADDSRRRLMGGNAPLSPCAKAAIEHHYDETVEYRLDAGVLGLAGLAATWLVRRRMRANVPRLRALIPIAGTSLFGVAALGLVGLGVMQAMVSLDSGAGAMLSAGTVSAAFFVVFGARLLQSLAEPRLALNGE